jgi:hypothetical protein
MDEQPKAKGGQPHQRTSTGVLKTPVATVTLDEAGTDKNLAKRARQAGGVLETPPGEITLIEAGCRTGEQECGFFGIPHYARRGQHR